MERLMGAILLKAIEDWEDPAKRPDVEKFLDSEWFAELAEGLQLKPEIIRGKLKMQDYKRLDIRAAYR